MIHPSDSLAALLEAPFTAADRALALHLREDWGESEYWILFAAALCSLSVREGHTYCDLEHPERFKIRLSRPWPSQQQWRDLFASSPAARLETEVRSVPLVLCPPGALYLDKYYEFEQRLARLLRERAEASSGDGSGDAVQRAASSPFFVITGGPGTGKTTLALRYLNALLDRWSESRPPRFVTVAPTGKAAARLAESISEGVARLELPVERKEQLSRIPCLTIHRLLGVLPHRSAFRRNASHPLAFDSIVIDESSMIDLPLMLRLFEALQPACQVLLLGDKDQLSSVDVGSVLNDLLQAAERTSSPLRHSVHRLSKTYRFSEDSSIYQACQYARSGDAEKLVAMLGEKRQDFAFHRIPEESRAIPESALRRALDRYRALVAHASPADALRALTASMTLTPTRRGAFGSVAFNAAVERRIRMGLQESSMSVGLTAPLHGTPILVQENDYELELFNGDLGIIWSSEEGLAAYFPNQQYEPRRFRQSELPRHELAFALTIHKSQGSEFEETVVLLGAQDSQLISRELVYTAFSRARKRLVVYAAPGLLASSVERRASRATRLAELLG